MVVNLVNLNNYLKICIFQYLPITDYASVSRTCKTINNSCTDPIMETIYWKTVYQNLYSDRDLQEESISLENPWKKRIKIFEESLKEQKIFSNKFRVCVEFKCEKMGSLKKEMSKVDSAILTICLRDLLIKKCALDSGAKLELAKVLLDHGANPLKESNVYLEDSPLRMAILNDSKEMVDLFIVYIEKNKENITTLNQLSAEIKQKFTNSVSSVLDQFNNSFC